FVGYRPLRVGLDDPVRGSLHPDPHLKGVSAGSGNSGAEILAVVSDGRQTYGDCSSKPALLFLAFTPGIRQGSGDLRLSELAHIPFSQANGRKMGRPGTRAELCRRDGNDGRYQTPAVP